MEIELWSTAFSVAGSAVRGLIVYACALVTIRLVGRRTVAQLSAFDAVVTIAIGSVAAGAALRTGASVADGVAVLLTFVVLQALVGAVRKRVPRLRRLLDFPPEVIVRDGKPSLPSSPLSAQMTIDELQGRLRRAGIADIGAVTVAVLEATGDVTATVEDPKGTLYDIASSGTG